MEQTKTDPGRKKKKPLRWSLTVEYQEKYLQVL